MHINPAQSGQDFLYFLGKSAQRVAKESVAFPIKWGSSQQHCAATGLHVSKKTFVGGDLHYRLRH